MKKFGFKLEGVAEHRRHREEEMKLEYLQAQARRLAAEAFLNGIRDHRAKLLRDDSSSLESRLTLEAALLRSEDAERSQLAVIEVLAVEEARALETWRRAKQDFEALSKMREGARHAWKRDCDRAEQRGIDEWAVTRRAA